VILVVIISNYSETKNTEKEKEGKQVNLNEGSGSGVVGRVASGA